jgi:hypothetical protein
MPSLESAPGGDVVGLADVLGATASVRGEGDSSVDHVVACYYARPTKVL